MSSNSSGLSKTTKPFETNQAPIKTAAKRLSSEESDSKQTSIGSRDSHNTSSVSSIPKPKVTVLEQINHRKSAALELYNRPDDMLKGTATSHNSTAPTVITAVLRDLRDDIVRSPDYRQAGPVAMVNGERSIAVIGGENIYVQNKTKFIPVPRDKALNNHQDYHFWTYHSPKLEEHSPLDVALFVQKAFNPISSICFGLLGGVALLQLFLAHFLVGKWTEQDQTFFLQTYSKIAQLTPLLFYLLLTVCIVSVLDRVPLKREAVVFEPSWVIVAVYILTLILSLSCASFDDMISLYHQNRTLFQDQMKTQEIVSDWKLMNTLRCLLAILGWIMVSITNPTDLLLQHLLQIKQTELEKQAPSISISNMHA